MVIIVNCCCFLGVVDASDSVQVTYRTQRSLSQTFSRCRRLRRRH